MADQSDGETIAASGDVILKVGKAATITLRVSSVILATASSVFAALLGPHFREGSAPRSAAAPVEIPLPEDDPIAMWGMCRLLHFKPLNREQDQFSNRLLGLAVTIDKYDCIEALRLSMRALLMAPYLLTDGKFAVANPQDLVHVLHAACLLKDDVCYEKVTRILIETITVPFSELRKHLINIGSFPGDVLLAMEEKRGRARQKISQGIVTAIEACCAACGLDHNTSKAKTKYLCDVFQCSTWPPSFADRNLSIATALGHVYQFQIFHHNRIRTKQCSCSSWGHDGQVFRDLEATVRALCMAPCMHCILENCAEWKDGPVCTDHA